MSELTVEQRLEKLEKFIYDKALHLEMIDNKGGGNCELLLTNCPVCKHTTIQIKGYWNNECLTCGHKLAERIVAID